MSWRMCYSAVFAKEAESIKGTQREQFLLVLWCSLPEAEQEVGVSYRFLNTNLEVPHRKDRYPEFSICTSRQPFDFQGDYGARLSLKCLFVTMIEFEGRITNPYINLSYVATAEWPSTTNLAIPKTYWQLLPYKVLDHESHDMFTS